MSAEYKVDLQGFEKWLREQKKQHQTIEGYCSRLNTFSNLYDGIFSKENIREFEETYIESGKSPNTINAHIMAINKYIEYLQCLGEQNLDDWIMTAQKIRTVQYLDDILSMADYEFLLKKAALQKEWLVYTYARMAGTTGMRLSEMLQIKREHLENGCVDIYGKGAKRRRIYFPKSMQTDLLRLLDYLGLKSGFIFSPKFKGDRPYGEHGAFIQKKMRKFGEECEFPTGLCHPHGFRHFFAKEFIRRNQNISLLADLLGHSDVNVTRIYLKMTSKEQAEVVNETVTW